MPGYKLFLIRKTDGKFTCKDRLVTGGHKTVNPLSDTYSCIVATKRVGTTQDVTYTLILRHVTKIIYLS